MVRYYYEYDDNSTDDFNAKSDNVQSESEDDIMELEELENNNLEYSEAAPSKSECGINGSGSCSSQEDCKQCLDCPNGAACVGMGWTGMNKECRCHGYIDCGMFC